MNNILPRDENDFTEDEGRVITASKSGLTRRMMAAELGMNFNTFVGHLKNIFDQLGIHSITQLAMYAVDNGY